MPINLLQTFCDVLQKTILEIVKGIKEGTWAQHVRTLASTGMNSSPLHPQGIQILKVDFCDAKQAVGQFKRFKCYISDIFSRTMKFVPEEHIVSYLYLWLHDEEMNIRDGWKLPPEEGQEIRPSFWALWKFSWMKQVL